MPFKELQNLDELNRGIDKHWIWNNKNYECACDYIQKINYNIQDLNQEIQLNLNEPSRKDIVFTIVLIDWICEAVDSIFNLLKPDVKRYLNISKSEELKQSMKYFKAIRSFVVAHPLNTTRHEMFGLDGDFICVDIFRNADTVTSCLTKQYDWFLIDMNGLHNNAKDLNGDFVLYVYSQNINGMKFFQYIKVRLEDLLTVASLQIERLYQLDKKLSNVTKKKVYNTNE